MKNDVACVEVPGDFECFEGEVHRSFAIKRTMRGELVSVRCVDHNLDRRWEVIVHARAVEEALIESLFNPRILRHGHAVGELDRVETKIDNLLDQSVTFCVTVVIPASGEGEHYGKFSVFS